MKKLIHLSVVSPVYQAEETVDELIKRLFAILPNITYSFEIILVEDGSLDESWNKIKAQCAIHPEITGIRLSRNFGQHSAISAGIESAHGEWIVVMDCDLQDQPEEIVALYQKAQSGYDIVLASRTKRKDSYFKHLLSKIFYKFLSFLTSSKYDHSIANFGIYRRRVINAILCMPEKIRFFPAMVNWVGFSKVTIPVEHGQRFKGESSYNFYKQFRLAVDIMLAYSNKPLKMIIGLGSVVSLITFIFGFIIFCRRLMGYVPISGYASLIVSIAFFSGVMISVLGVVGLYIGKIFEGIKDRPIYLIRERKSAENQTDSI